MIFQKPTGALENYVGLIPVAPGDKAPLTREQSEMFIRMCMADDAKIASVWSGVIADKGGLFQAQILESRLASVGMANLIDPKVKFFCSYLSDSPGKVVMWAFTLSLMAVRTGGKVTITSFSEPEYFGFGVPTEEYSHSQWDKQKRSSVGFSSDNWIDSPDLWPRAESEQGQEETKQDKETTS